jgi:hypothetical protein
MRVWEVPFKIQLDRGTGRSPGLHVSEVIRDLALRGGILDRKWATDNIEDAPERVALGLAWEEWIHKQHPEICFHPGEIIVDDVAMSIDGASFNEDEASIFTSDSDGAVHEFKLTWKSSRYPVTDDWMWMAQLKSYIHGMRVSSVAKINVGFMHVFYVMGNYGKDRTDPESNPRYKIFGIEFTDLQIHENWSMIKAHAKRMKTKK